MQDPFIIILHKNLPCVRHGCTDFPSLGFKEKEERSISILVLRQKKTEQSGDVVAQDLTSVNNQVALVARQSG